MGKIGKWRDTMQFREEYGKVDHSYTVRFYLTNRSGMYGYQWRCIIFSNAHESVASSLTGGCGYDKRGAALADALLCYGNANDCKNMEAVRIAESGEVEKALEAQFGTEPDYHAHP